MPAHEAIGWAGTALSWAIAGYMVFFAWQHRKKTRALDAELMELLAKLVKECQVFEDYWPAQNKYNVEVAYFIRRMVERADMSDDERAYAIRLLDNPLTPNRKENENVH